MDANTTAQADDPPIVIRVHRAAGEVYVGPGVFPRAGGVPGRRRRFDDSNARQKRKRAWRLVCDRGLVMVTSFDRLVLPERGVALAARRLRERHQRRFDDDCDYWIVREARQPGSVHVFTVSYPLDDQDVVTDLFPIGGPDPVVRVVADADELKSVLYDAAEVFWSGIKDVDLHAMSRTGPKDVLEGEAVSLQAGLEQAERIVSPDALYVDRIEHFGSRPRAYGRTRPSIPFRVPRPKGS